MMIPRLLFLVGPTGSGKSELGILLAKSINGEIISCDSMLVYKGMNIGTAKLSFKERKGIRHHCMDLTSPRQKLSVYKYRQAALKAISDIFRRGHLPIIVGGSGLYIKGLLDGIAPQTCNTAKHRTQLELLESKKGLSYLYERLRQVDPKRAAEILPTDKRRIIRALEIYEAFHQKPSEWRLRTETLEDLGYSCKIYGLMRDRVKLYERINVRADKMIQNGFVQEVKRLKRTGFSVTSRQAIGYSEILQYLKGKISLKDAVELIKKRSRHLAKKQLIWFRQEKRIQWIQIGESRTALNQAGAKIVRMWHHGE